MKMTIYPSALGGIVQAPASKSSMQRACAAALLHEGSTRIYQPGHSNDDKAALDIIQKLGATLTRTNEEWLVESAGVSPVSNEINCGESGLSIRMFTPIAALSDKKLMIQGSGSLVTRPMDFFDDILPALGVNIKSNDGKLPLTVKGPIVPTDLEVDGSLSSQFLTGLLMAYSAAFMKKGHVANTVTLTVLDLKSKPYIDLTLAVMEQFGMLLPENRNYKEFVFHKGTIQEAPATVQYQVEGDWSGGAFLLIAGAVAGPITVRGLDTSSTQADKAILNALMAAGAGIAMDGKQIQLHPQEMQAFEFDATDCPDLFPPLVTLAAFCRGLTRIKGTQRLVHKESNRALTLQEEFGKLGLKIELHENEMWIHGTGALKSATVHSRHDHRIAMACAIAALRADGPVSIEEAHAVNKSYPDFYQDLKKLNARLDEKLWSHWYSDQL